MAFRSNSLQRLVVTALALATFMPALSAVSRGEALPTLTRHIRKPEKLAQARLIGKLPDSTPMQLHIMLNLGDPEGLKSYVAQVADPTSPNYKRYLTPGQFTERFGPSQQSYDTAVAYFKANGFNVVGGSRDGFDIQVKATAATVEAALHITVNRYQHPTEDRTFIVTDREPTVDLPFQLWHITGLDTLSKPHPMFVKKADYAKARGISTDAVVTHATTGSGPSASFLGSDMRAAYYGGTTLTGAGIDMGLLEFEGTDLADLTTYYTNVHQTLPITPVLLSVDGVSTSCTDNSAGGDCDDTEQTLDMTQALGMAPGMSSLTEYFGNSTDTTQDDAGIISAMTTHSPLPITIGCSWGWFPTDETTLDPYFEKMAVQGQTFFAASGDNSTWTESNLGEDSEAWPADDPYIVAVGGTDLTTASAAGAWKSETAWADSGGGINQDSIPIPSYQALTGVITSTNKGSTTLRNGPDVSANANYSFYVCADQTTCTANAYGGTSFAAPMWAAYLALADQAAKANGNPLLGFINPAIYPLGLGSAYGANFHDITSGTSGSNSAHAGYDLVTGWGSPNGAALITTLIAPVLTSSPATGSTATTFAETLAYPGFDGTATIYDAVGSGTPATLGTCAESTSSLNSCAYSFLGSKLGPGPYNLSGSLTWVEITGTSTNSSETTKTAVVTPITIIDATSSSEAATPSTIASTGSSSIKVTVVDSVTATFIPTGTVSLNLGTAGGTSLGSCTLSAGTCTVTVQGSALATGTNTIVLSYPGVTNTYAASSGSVTVTVTAGTAGGAITFSSVSHNFGQVQVGTAAAAFGLNVTNGSSTTAYPFSLVFTAAHGFTSSNTCGSSIAAGATCEIVFYFTPTATGAVSATWSLAAESGFTYSPSNGGTLSGTGTPPGEVALTSTGHNFGTVTVGTTSSAYATELSNSTTSAETITLGTVSAPFTMLTNCGTTLPAGASCEIEFTYKPTTTSPESVVVPLSGTPATITSEGEALPSGGITLTGN